MELYGEELEVIDWKHDERGIPTHVVGLTQDPDPSILMEGPAEQIRMAGFKANMRPVSLPRNTREDHYTLKNDDRLSEAWGAYSEGRDYGCGYTYDGDELVEVFERYVRVFHPGAVTYHANIATGCSQGDWAELMLWMDADAVEGEWGKYVPTQAHAQVRAYDCLKAYTDEFETAATGEAYAVHEVPLILSVDIDSDGTSGTLEIELDEVHAESCWGYAGHEHAVSAAKHEYL